MLDMFQHPFLVLQHFQQALSFMCVFSRLMRFLDLFKIYGRHFSTLEEIHGDSVIS